MRSEKPLSSPLCVRLDGRQDFCKSEPHLDDKGIYHFIFISVVNNFSIPMSCQHTLVGARRDSFSDEPCGNCQRFPSKLAYFSKIAWFAVEIPSGGRSLQPRSWVLITSLKASPPPPSKPSFPTVTLEMF